MTALRRPKAFVLVASMALLAIFLWVGVPAGWLWIGSQVQNSTGVGTAIMIAMVGSVATILALVPVLVRLNRRHLELREQEGLSDSRHTALEVIMVASAGVAIVGFGIWFFGFSGSSPIPLNFSY